MNEHINYLAVGGFILLGAIALLAVGFWVGGAGQAVPTSGYTILFERNVNGLAEGSPVRYLGVDVGKVNNIGLSGTGGKAVEVQIDIARSTPVDSGTYASLAYQGITGVAFINLASEPGEHGSLVATDGRPYPVLPARDIGIAALLNSGPAVVERLDTLLGNAGAIVDEKNRKSVTRILENLEEVTGALAEQRGELATIPAQMSETLATLQDTLEQVRDVMAQARPELLATTQNLRQTTENLRNATGWLGENEAAIDSFLAGGLGETAALVADTRVAMRELQKLSAELRNNPSRVIYKPKLEPIVVAQ
jgi:phospholipid/cholesterol/gamma-HCH transport system substrate-binding protein